MTRTTRQHRVAVRLTPAEFRAIRHAAYQSGRTFGDQLRELAAAGLKELEAETPPLDPDAARNRPE